MKTATPTQKADAIFGVLKAIGDTIREASPIPSGTLYAGLMTAGCTMQQYDQIIDAFIGAGKIRKDNDLLYWIA